MIGQSPQLSARGMIGTDDPSTVSPYDPSDHRFVMWQAHQVKLHHCESLSIAHKRQAFAAMRRIGHDTAESGQHMFMPHLGLTIGEFAVLYIVADHIRRNIKVRRS